MFVVGYGGVLLVALLDVCPIERPLPLGGVILGEVFECERRAQGDEAANEWREITTGFYPDKGLRSLLSHVYIGLACKGMLFCTIANGQRYGVSSGLCIYNFGVLVGGNIRCSALKLPFIGRNLACGRTVKRHFFAFNDVDGGGVLIVLRYFKSVDEHVFAT